MCFQCFIFFLQYFHFAVEFLHRLADLADLNELDVAAWHGMGPKALDALKAEMQKQGLQFRGKNK